MSYVIESGLPDLLHEIGTELHDLTLTEADDGRISRDWAARTFETAVREVFRRLRRDGIDPLQFKQEFSLTEDSSDSYLYPLNRRVRQIIRVYDDNNQTTESGYTNYWPVSTYDSMELGWVLEPGGIRLRGEPTIIGTLKAWVIQTPIRQSYGEATSATSTGLVLQASADIGVSSKEPNYYIGSRVGIESASTGVGEVRRVTAYDESTRTCTVAAWTATPTGTIKYSFLLDLPDCMQRAVVLRAALLILRADKAIDREMDDVAAAYIEAYESGKSLLKDAKVSYLPQFREVFDAGFRDLS